MFPVEYDWGLWVLRDFKYSLITSYLLINQLIVSLLHQRNEMWHVGKLKPFPSMKKTEDQENL